MSDGNKSGGEVAYFRNEMIARCRVYIAGMAEIGADPRDLEAALAPLLINDAVTKPSLTDGQIIDLANAAFRDCNGGSLARMDNDLFYLRTVRAALAQQPPAEAQTQDIGPEWKPCRKRPVIVHVREQRPGEQHVSTREGITAVKPDDLIMRGVEGEEYPIGRELFAKTYVLVEAQAQGGGEVFAWFRKQPRAWEVVKDSDLSERPSPAKMLAEGWTPVYTAPPSAPETEENVAADSYHYLTEMLEPYVARDGSNPNGPFPASVVESFQMLLEHWKATQPPSAPVGVGVHALPERWRTHKSGLSALGCANELEHALAQQPAPSATVGVEVRSLPALWRQREDNGEEHTEFDKGYEQASDECAEALERALAQQPAVDPLVEWGNRPLNFTATVGTFNDGTQPAAVDGDFIKRIANSLIAKGWDIDPDCDGTGVVELREAVISALAQRPVTVDEASLHTLQQMLRAASIFGNEHEVSALTAAIAALAAQQPTAAHWVADAYGGYWQVAVEGKPYNFRNPAGFKLIPASKHPSAVDEAMPVLVELVATLAATGTVTGGRIYFPERQTRELLKRACDALAAQPGGSDNG